MYAQNWLAASIIQHIYPQNILTYNMYKIEQKVHKDCQIGNGYYSKKYAVENGMRTQNNDYWKFS